MHGVRKVVSQVGYFIAYPLRTPLRFVSYALACMHEGWGGGHCIAMTKMV